MRHSASMTLKAVVLCGFQLEDATNTEAETPREVKPRKVSMEGFTVPLTH